MTEELETKSEVLPYVSNEPEDVKEVAKLQGWTEFDEFIASGKDAKEWRPASVFIERGKLFKRYDELKQHTSELKDQLKIMAAHQRNTAAIAKQQALDELKKEKKEALENNDSDKVLVIDDKIDAIKARPEVVIDIPEERVNLDDQSFLDWVAEDEHQWYLKDKALQSEADKIADEWRKANPTGLQSTMFKHVDSTIKESNLKKFSKDKTTSKVSSGERTTGSGEPHKSKLTSFPHEFQKTVRSYVEYGAFKNEEEAMKSYELAAKQEGKSLEDYVASICRS